MTPKLGTVKDRNALKPRREPYWLRLDSGCILGFRKMTPDSAGSWTARFRDADTGNASEEVALGEFADLPPSERYGAAKPSAEEWFAHLGKGGNAEAMTVKGACENYVKHMREARQGQPPPMTPSSGSRGSSTAPRSAASRYRSSSASHVDDGARAWPRRWRSRRTRARPLPGPALARHAQQRHDDACALRSTSPSRTATPPPMPHGRSSSSRSRTPTGAATSISTSRNAGP